MFSQDWLRQKYFMRFFKDLTLIIPPFVEPFQSLETLKRHKQTHNDIKPQNFLVKFSLGYDSYDLTKNDLTQIEIALTDFGMADAKGGTPIYASPECAEKTNTKSDIFSFGRLILFLLLTKVQFIKWLYIPISNKARIYIRNKKFFFETFPECNDPQTRRILQTYRI